MKYFEGNVVVNSENWCLAKIGIDSGTDSGEPSGTGAYFDPPAMTASNSTACGVTVEFSTSSGMSGVYLATSAVTAVDSADTEMATAFRAALLLLSRRFKLAGKRGK